MKIGFAARWSPLDKGSWSGTCHYAYNELIKDAEVYIYTYKWPWRIREWLTMQKSFYKRIRKQHTSVEFLKDYAKYFSRQLEKDLEKRPVDILFVCASPQLISYINTRIPIVLMTDATFKQIQEYYPYFSNLSKRNVRQGIELDKKAFLKASHCLLTSDWCKRSAINDYGVSEESISVTNLGANLENVPSQNELSFDKNGTCRLLFLGVEWERKGGNIAVETFRLLKKEGINVHLQIIGCTPPDDLSTDNNISIIPFLDKNNSSDLNKLHKILLDTDFLLLPSRAECAGVVFSEASAYGIPSITTDTGGVSSVVENGINGYTLPPDAAPEEYAVLIRNIYSDDESFFRLRKSSRAHYDSHMTWQRWHDRFFQIAKSILNKPVPLPL